MPFTQTYALAPSLTLHSRLPLLHTLLFSFAQPKTEEDTNLLLFSVGKD